MTNRKRLSWALAVTGVSAIGAVALATGVPGVSGPGAGAPEVDLRVINTVPPSPGAWEFPAGLTYPAALTEVYRSERLGGAPVGARRVAALPPGIVALIPPDGGSVVIDLAAPYGYDPATGERLGPALRLLPGTSPDSVRKDLGAGKAIPAGVALAIPILPPCMRGDSREQVASRTGCPASATVEFNAERLPGPPIDG